MEQNEIIEGDFLMAAFMGRNSDHVVNGRYDIYFSYHNSWNWLIPVCEKLTSLKEAVTFNPIVLASMDIEKVFLEVVDYIKWYNTQQTIVQ